MPVHRINDDIENSCRAHFFLCVAVCIDAPFIARTGRDCHGDRVKRLCNGWCAMSCIAAAAASRVVGTSIGTRVGMHVGGECFACSTEKATNLVSHLWVT